MTNTLSTISDPRPPDTLVLSPDRVVVDVNKTPAILHIVSPEDDTEGRIHVETALGEFGIAVCNVTVDTGDHSFPFTLDGKAPATIDGFDGAQLSFDPTTRYVTLKNGSDYMVEVADGVEEKPRKEPHLVPMRLRPDFKGEYQWLSDPNVEPAKNRDVHYRDMRTNK